MLEKKKIRLLSEREFLTRNASEYVQLTNRKDEVNVMNKENHRDVATLFSCVSEAQKGTCTQVPPSPFSASSLRF